MTGAARTITAELETFRVELVGYAYRMLGSAAEAEDAAQETLVRAWRNAGRYDRDRASLRTWVYRIATNVCVDLLRSAGRRAHPIDLGPAAIGGDLGPPLAETAYVQPILDERAIPDTADPAEHAALRESIRLAFVAALQHLPPKQRAVLILRDVLQWPAGEVAGLLDSSTAAVNSALQRARATLEDRPIRPARPLDDEARALLDRYCDAFARYDVDAMVSLLHTDATTSMPPFAWRLRGREAIGAVLRLGDGSCRDAYLLPVAANGSPAAWQIRPDGPFALEVFEIAGGAIIDITTFLGPEAMSFAPPGRIPSEDTI
jgi:RNA polymerase sigma-70 factor (ECF subfamily)